MVIWLPLQVAQPDSLIKVLILSFATLAIAYPRKIGDATLLTIVHHYSKTLYTIPN